MTRTCPRCKIEKPLSEFGVDRSRKNGIMTYCKRCSTEKTSARYHADPVRGRAAQRRNWEKTPVEVRRARRRKVGLAVYGMTPHQYEAMQEAQGGLCAICEQPPKGGRWPVLYVDHDHESGAVRGLVCSDCNIAMGKLGDDPERMERMVGYVRRNRLHVVKAEGGE